MDALSQQDVLAVSKNWGWFFTWGAVLVVLGILAVSYSFSTTLVSVIFLGVLLAAAGVIVILNTFFYWRHSWRSFFGHLITGLLYLVVGILFIKGPIFVSVSLTLLLAIFYIALGLFRIIYSLSAHLPERGWRVFSGILALLFGVLVLAAWPASGLFIIGLFIGIELLVCGWVSIMAALSVRALAHQH